MKQFGISVVFCAVMVIVSGCVSHRTSDSACLTSVQTNPVIYDVETSVEKHTARGVANHYKLLGIFTWGDQDYADFAFSVKKANADMPSTVEGLAGSILLPFLEIISPRNVYEDMKMAATYDACKASGAYSLIGAKYEISTSNYLILRKVKCIVTGYPVKITGFKRVQAANETAE